MSEQNSNRCTRDSRTVALGILRAAAGDSNDSTACTSELVKFHDSVVIPVMDPRAESELIEPVE